jgi:sarcosine oxidase subunit delta
MLKLTCPCCKIIADETELTPAGEAHISRLIDNSTDEEFGSYLFSRKNPKGVHFERWVHTYGCGKWFIAARCTITLEVFGTYSAQTLKPPTSIVKRIKTRRPDWIGFTK